MSDVTCYLCDGKGHYKKDCPKKKEWERSERLKGGGGSNGKEVAALVDKDDSDSDYSGFY